MGCDDALITCLDISVAYEKRVFVIQRIVLCENVAPRVSRADEEFFHSIILAHIKQGI
jgi:uncharacterized linocin/CFP29 family protein